MNQTTNSILMIRPVAFRMNEQTAVNNYYQKVLDNLTPTSVNAKAQEEFDTFVQKLRMIGLNVVVVEDTLSPDTPDSIFPNNWISFHENGDVVLFMLSVIRYLLSVFSSVLMVVCKLLLLGLPILFNIFYKVKNLSS